MFISYNVLREIIRFSIKSVRAVINGKLILKRVFLNSSIEKRRVFFAMFSRLIKSITYTPMWRGRGTLIHISWQF